MYRCPKPHPERFFVGFARAKVRTKNNPNTGKIRVGNILELIGKFLGNFWIIFGKVLGNFPQY